MTEDRQSPSAAADLPHYRRDTVRDWLLCRACPSRLFRVSDRGGGLGMPKPASSCDVEVRVRYAETDAMGYLHHAQYLVYFEIGRTELLRLNGLRYRDMEKRGLFYVVARLECRFRAPARYDDVLTLTTSTTKLSPVRVDHHYELKRDGQLLTEANSTLVLVARDGRPTTLPDDLYDILRGTSLE